MARARNSPRARGRVATEQAAGGAQSLSCGTIQVTQTDDGDDGNGGRDRGDDGQDDQDDDQQQPPRLPGIGPITQDNPRALAAAAVAGGVLLASISG